MKLVLVGVSIFLLVSAGTRGGGGDLDASIDSMDLSRNSAGGARNEADIAAIDKVWRGLKQALESNDLTRVGQFFTESSRSRYVTLYSYLGSRMADVPSTWSSITAIELTENMAMYAYVQDDPAGEHMYRVVFVRVPNKGWRIQEM